MTDVAILEPSWCAIGAGSFLMGSAPCDSDASDEERPQHQVSLAAYAMARYPVTNAQWLLFVDDGGAASRQECDGRFNNLDQPVVGVSWYAALAFARWVSSRLGYRVRMPTEAEWEKASRGPDGRRYPFGDVLPPNSIRAQSAHDEAGGAGPWPVGRRLRSASPYGIEDLVGNTYSWTTSRWGPAETALTFPYPYRSDDGRELLDADDLRVVRGGAWNFPLRNSRCAYRGKDRPGDAFDNLGVRLVKDLPEQMESTVGGATQ